MTRLPEIANPKRKPYPSDLSDVEWEVLKPLVPAPKGLVIRSKLNFARLSMPYFMYNLLDANGKCCPMTSHPTLLCMATFKNGNRFGIWQQMHDQVRERLRTELGRDKQSTVA